MKHWYYFLAFLFISSFISYSQNIAPHFSELKGMEDYNGNTNLLYRIYSSYLDPFNDNQLNDIYLFNVANKVDSLFQSDYSYYNYYLDSHYRDVKDYDFWKNDPGKFIVCGSYGGFEPSSFIERFDQRYLFPAYMISVDFIGISHQNDSLIYGTFERFLIRSTTGGISWDTVNNYNAFSLSPYNDKVLFGTGLLTKTTNGGVTYYVVDTIPSNGYFTDRLFYDKDTNYIYRTGYYYPQYEIYKLLVSNNSGELNSWQVKFTSPLPVYLSVDYAFPGSIYLATNKYIYHSTDFGNTFILSNSFDKRLVGIYKKPGSSKLYAATDYIIYEIDGSTINIIKQLPVDKVIFSFDPLDIGNKWVYKSQFIVPEETIDFISTKEIVKDTVLANQQSFKQIKSIYLNSKIVVYSYERIDSSNGKVYFWDSYTGTEYQGDDLSINLGDTINVSRFGNINPITSFDSLSIQNMFGQSKDKHAYNSPNDPLGYGDRYSLTKDFGITYHKSSSDQVETDYYLKGCIIKGVVYGDTSFIVGIKDKPVQPVKFALSQNYPNPFNPSTTIKYSIASRGIVTLKIYDILGKEIAVLINAEKEPGNYDINFNASRLSSGIYFYTLRSSGNVLTKKMLLIK